MSTLDPFLSLAVALGLGLLIGLEREQRAEPDHDGRLRSVGGARTYPLVALAGALSMMAGQALGLWIVGLVLVGFLALLVSAYVDDVRKDRGRGITSETALILTYLLGVLALSGDALGTQAERLTVVSSMGVAIAALLSFKDPLHGFARRISQDDLYAILKFLIAAVIILPLLPDQAMGPLDAFNPFHTGLMVVMIAGIGLVGYLAIRVLGTGRGLGVTGLVGGLVSSTAVTLAMSERAKREPDTARGCALGVVLASTVMFGRILGVVAVLNEGLLPRVAIPLGAMMVAGLVASAILYLRSRAERYASEEVSFTNPFELISALKFGVLFALVLLASKAATHTFGQSGTYLTGVISGTTDVDAITLSMVRLAREGLSPEVAATTILLATFSNTAVKAGMAVFVGGWRFGARVLLVLGGMLAAGAGGLIVMWAS